VTKKIMKWSVTREINVSENASRRTSVEYHTDINSRAETFPISALRVIAGQGESIITII